MKKRNLTVILLGAAMLTGCAPRVVTEMYTTDYAPTQPDSVRVFALDDVVPPQTLAIGEVKVVDNGFSVGGSFDRVMRMAVEATAQHGGNALVITDHRSPDVRSTIHRVWGTMLRMPDGAIVAADTVKRPTGPMTVDAEEYEEFLQYKEDRRRYEQQRDAFMAERERILDAAPRNILRVSAGPTWLASKYQIGNHLYKSRMGYGFTADYDHVWRSGFGFGINVLHNYTSFAEGVKTRLNYVGPSLVLALPADKWRLDFALGVGYCNYRESLGGHSESEGHVAPMVRWGVECRVAPHLALGLQMNVISVSMKKPDDVKLEKNEFYGIQEFGVQAGLRYYF